jgi:hypothetical protein
MDPGIESTARQQRSMDAWYVDTQMQGDIQSGLITQRTVYPWHFDAESARLTPLARRDLTVLAGYYKTTPGSLVLVRGEASDGLYAARQAAVRDVLRDAGVDVGTVAIADGVPGGRGISGQYIVDSVKNDKGSFSGTSSDTGSITSEGLTSGSDSSTKGSNR